jgi:hypothetical protein
MNTSIDIATRVDQYVKLRDKIKELDDTHKATMKPMKELLDDLNADLLARLNDAHGNSISTDFGTVYRTEKKTAPLADPEVFMQYVVENEAWDLMDRKANVTAVAEFVEEHKTLPPGCNLNISYVVGVRRK